jgi:hypothetical protein
MGNNTLTLTIFRFIVRTGWGLEKIGNAQFTEQVDKIISCESDNMFAFLI